MSRVRNFVIYGLPIGASDDAPPTPPEDQEFFYNDSAETDIFYNDSAQTDPFTTPGTAPALGVLTTAYSGAIASNGGTITAAQEQLIDDFLYSEYPNASAGVGTVASFISAFSAASTGIFPFFGNDLSAARTPAVGHGLAPLSNVGFVEGSYSPTLGLQGDGTSYMVINSTLTDLTPNNITVMVAATTDGGTSQNYVFSFSGTDQIRAGTTFNGNFYLRIKTGSGLTIASPPTNLIATLQSTAVEQRLYSGLVSVATAAAATGTFTNTELRVGHNTGSFTGVLYLLAIPNRALTADERTILHNATAAFVAARKLL